MGHEKAAGSEPQEEKHVRISVTDPEAALGKDKFKVFRPLYNVQYVRDLDSYFWYGVRWMPAMVHAVLRGRGQEDWARTEHGCAISIGDVMDP